MSTRRLPPGPREHAERLAALGLATFPLVGKVPALRGDWRLRATTDPHVLRRLYPPYRSYGVLCSAVAVIDTDTPELAAWWGRNMPQTPWSVKTPRGGRHFYYRGDESLGCATKVGGRWDVRAGNKGYAVGPGSRLPDGRAYVLEGEITLDLPPFDPDWLPAKPAAEVPPAAEERRAIVRADIGSMRRLTRARAYAAKVTCVEHRGAHNDLYRLCCWLRDELGMSAEEAYHDVLLPWNQTNCFREDGVTPYPWSASELKHKVRDTFGRQL